MREVRNYRGRIALSFSLLGLVPAISQAVTRDEVIARAQAWVDDDVPYSFSAWYTDPTTGVCCYRTDCSGYVSAVWGLPAPGHTTYSFAGGPWDDGVSYVISASQLLKGDALNYPGDPNAGTGHIMLYVSGDFNSGWVEVYEEYSSGTTATHRWRSIDPSIYLPIRYTGIEDCSAEICDGKDNDCDGLVDEIATLETCDGKDNDCDGKTDEDYVCEVDDEPALSAWRRDPAASSDLNGDGFADVCTRGTAGLDCYLYTASGFQRLPTLTALSDAEGFADLDQYSTLRLADVTGDGRADACARHSTLGFQCWPSTGAGFGAAIPGPALTDALGWSDPANYTTLRMVDLEGDGKADLCGRTDSQIYCWKSDGQRLTTVLYGPALSDASGWNQVMYYSTLRFADVNGDGLQDVCARSKDGLDCWLFNGQSFPTHLDGPALSNSAGWDEPQYYLTLEMPDINGDGKSDVCARAQNALYCWLSSGTAFGSSIVGPALSNDLGWGAYPYYSTLRFADVTGDGKDDVCGRSSTGVYCWPSTGTGFGNHFAGPPLTNDAGWLDPSNYQTIALGDLSGEGRYDFCARTDSGLECWLGSGQAFPSIVYGPSWSDALGWDAEKFYRTFRFAAGRAAVSLPCVATEEVCDQKDNDCDGLIDEGVTGTYHPDLDQDGFGDTSSSTQSCSAPSGTVSDGTDCDDGRSDVHPGAEDVCEDGVDQDCDGVDATCESEGCPSAARGSHGLPLSSSVLLSLGLLRIWRRRRPRCSPK